MNFTPYKEQPGRMFIPDWDDIVGDKKMFVITDIHGYHKNIVRGESNWNDKNGCRAFDTIADHNSTIVNNINEKVGENDVLLHLGDWVFGGVQNVPLLRDRIICKTVINLFGNHDHHIRVQHLLGNTKEFAWCGDYLEFRYNKVFFTAFHYPLGSWNNMASGSINLHGHCHGSYKPVGKQIDCCPEKNNYKPRSLESVIQDMKYIQVGEVDHHKKDTNTHY